MAKRATNQRAKTSKGRPPGVRLDREQQQLIVGAIERGATPHASAQAVGIEPRTFRELRQRAQGRHQTRGPLLELASFFRQVDEASARARIRREIEVAESDAKHWLKHQARSRPGLDGWTEPIPEVSETSVPYVPTIDAIEEVVAELITSGAVSGPQCPDASCPCILHRLGRSDDVK